MIKATNGAEGIEVVRPKENVIVFIGHFGGGIISKTAMYAADAQKIFDGTGTTELSISGAYAGLIGWEPQGTTFFFPPVQNHDLICVDSDEFKREVERVLAS